MEDVGREAKPIFPVALVPSLELWAPDTGWRLRALAGLLRAYLGLARLFEPPLQSLT